MMVDEWNGWMWTCMFCGYISRAATDEEVERYENGV